MKKTTLNEVAAPRAGSKDHIRVDIDVLEIKDIAKPQAIECYVLGQLRDAGIPVLGLLFFRGVKHGRLTRCDDDSKPYAMIFEWSSNSGLNGIQN